MTRSRPILLIINTVASLQNATSAPPTEINGGVGLLWPATLLRVQSLLSHHYIIIILIASI